MDFVTITIHPDRIGIAAGSFEYVVNFTLPAKVDLLEKRLLDLCTVTRPVEFEVLLRGRTSLKRRQTLATIEEIAAAQGAAVVYGDRKAAGKSWLRGNDGDDAALIEAAKDRSFFGREIAEVEALAGFDARIARQWQEAA